MSGLVPFATGLVVEREPLKLADLSGQLSGWVQVVGGLAAAGLAIWLIAYWFQRPAPAVRGQRPVWQTTLFVLAVGGAALAYGIVGLIKLPEGLAALGGSEGSSAQTAAPGSPLLQTTCLTAGGAFAIFAVLLPFVVDLFRVRPRRIWALAKLSFKEAVRRRVLWVFLALLLVFLFASWFLPHKPEDQVRTYVSVVYFVMTVLLLMTASLLASFSIPADVRSQTIHTIVTKPVERFEIVLGRFLGYTLLMSLVLVVLTGCSLIYVARGIDEDAARETYRARVPLYGDLWFYGLTPSQELQRKGDDVGREFQYRSYIDGGANTPQRAIWFFQELPHAWVHRKLVPLEFSFDIFRTTKGEENKGVFCSLTFATWRWDPRREAEYHQERQREKSKPDPASDWDIDDRLAEKYGFYEFRSKEIFDYRTYAIDVPAGLFRNALEKADRSQKVPARGEAGDQGPDVPLLRILVKCESLTQHLGVAKRDLYLLDAEGWFGMNFFKGVVGLWYRLCLVIGLAVACSTYLSGIVSWLATMFLYGAGLFQEFIQSVVERTNIGGGPTESFIRLVNRQVPASQLDPTPVTTVANVSDEIFRWLMRRLLNVIPDIDRFDWTHYVAEGFDIAGLDLGVNGLLLVGYLLPWAVLSHYLIKWREIATW